MRPRIWSTTCDPLWRRGGSCCLLKRPCIGRTAARWYGVPIPEADDCVEVIVPPGLVVPRLRQGLRAHEGLGDDWCEHEGVKVTTPERTFLDLALVLRLRDLVIVGDAMVRAGLATVDSLRAAAAEAHRKRGVVLARCAAGLVRDRVDSPPETLVRLTLIEFGMPCPETGLDIFDTAGGWIGRPDLAYVAYKVAIQYEGDVHRTTRERWRADVRRDEVMHDEGWEVIRVTGHDLRRPLELCNRVRQRIRSQALKLGLPIPPGC
jgi:hypothetical protein